MNRYFATPILMGLLLASTVPAWCQPKMSTDRPGYSYGSIIKFVGEGLPPETPIEIYSFFQEDGAAAPGPTDYSLDGSITTGPRGIIEGERRAPASGNTGRSGNLIFELRPNNNREGAAKLVVRIVPIAVTPDFVGYEDTNGSLNLVVSGFIGFKDLYCHYIYQQPGKPNKELKTVKVGSLDPTTGGLKTKFKKFPFTPIPKGGYLIQFDGSPSYTDMRDNPPTPDKPYVLYSTSVI